MQPNTRAESLPDTLEREKEDASRCQLWPPRFPRSCRKQDEEGAQPARFRRAGRDPSSHLRTIRSLGRLRFRSGRLNSHTRRGPIGRVKSLMNIKERTMTIAINPA